MPKIPDIVREEVIGCPIKVIDAKNRANLGITGKIIDETKHFVIIETPRGAKKVHKPGNVFQITRLGSKGIIPGNCLFGAPEERIKINSTKRMED